MRRAFSYDLPFRGVLVVSAQRCVVLLVYTLVVWVFIVEYMLDAMQ